MWPCCLVDGPSNITKKEKLLLNQRGNKFIVLEIVNHKKVCQVLESKLIIRGQYESSCSYKRSHKPI